MTGDSSEQREQREERLQAHGQVAMTTARSIVSDNVQRDPRVTVREAAGAGDGGGEERRWGPVRS